MFEMKIKTYTFLLPDALCQFEYDIINRGKTTYWNGPQHI